MFESDTLLASVNSNDLIDASTWSLITRNCAVLMGKQKRDVVEAHSYAELTQIAKC